MTTKPNPAKKPDGGPAKAKASPSSVKVMKPSDAAGSGKRNAPREKPAASAPAKAPAKAPAPAPAAPSPAAKPLAAASSDTPSGKMGRASKRGSKRGNISLRTNLSAEISGLDKVIERDIQREKMAAAQASGEAIKTTDRATKETRKVYSMLGVVFLALVALAAFIIYQGWFRPPSMEELADLNGWSSAKMAVALKKIDLHKVRVESKGQSFSEDQKRDIIRNKLVEQILSLQVKLDKEKDKLNASQSGRSLDELQKDQRALALLQTMKDAYGQPWVIEFDSHDFVTVKSLGPNKVDDSGPAARDPKPNGDDLIVSAYLPFKEPAAMAVGIAEKPIEAPPPVDVTSAVAGAAEPIQPIGRGRPEDNEAYLKAQQEREKNK